MTIIKNNETSDNQAICKMLAGFFSFVKYVNERYEYADNTKNGDVYNNIATGKLMTEQQIFDEWLKINKMK